MQGDQTQAYDSSEDVREIFKDWDLTLVDGMTITYNPYVRGSANWWRWFLRWLNTVDIPRDFYEFQYLPYWADPRNWKD